MEPRARGWSFRIADIGGIALRIHATFAVLLAWIAITYLAADEDPAVALRGIVLVGSVFAIVVVHELAHAFVARRFGIVTRDITLYPIGGVAHLERMPDRPAQELLVALAGPAVNLLLALALFLGLRAAGADPGTPFAVHGGFATQLLWINVSLGVFNLVPAFPMDGGRVLRAILAMRLDRVRATVLAARIGRGCALVLGIVGLASSTMLVVIALFVWIAGEQEATLETLKGALHGVTAGEAMVEVFETLTPSEPLERAAARLAHGFQRDFPIVEDGRLVGILTREDVVRGLASTRPGTPVGQVMHRSVSSAGTDDDVASLVARLPPDGAPFVVVRDEAPVGLLDPYALAELLAVRRAA